MRHAFTLHHLITGYTDMFDYMNGVMRTLVKKKTQWQEDLSFAVRVAWQNLSKRYAEVTSTTGMLGISADILGRSGCCDCFGSVTRQWISILRTTHSLLLNTSRPFWNMWSLNIVPNTHQCQSVKQKTYRTEISSSPRWLQHPVNYPSICMISPVRINNTYRLPMWLNLYPDEVIVQYT